MDFGKISWRCGVDSTGSGQGPLSGSCEGGDETSSSGATECLHTEFHISRSLPYIENILT
jgi:hypothetical protein